MLSRLFKLSDVFPATFSFSVSRNKYFTVNFVLPFSVLVFCAQGLIAQELMSASYLPVRKEMAAFAMAALVFRTNTNFWPINTGNSQYSGTKNSPDNSLRPFNHLPDRQQKGCFSKVPKGDTEQLLNVLHTSPPGCTVEIEGAYFLDASIDIKVNLVGKSSLQEPEPDEPVVFFRIESARTDSDQKTGFRSSVLSGEPLSYTRYPEAVLVMDENKGSRLRIHPSAKLNNITVLSPPTDFDPHRGCMDNRIIFQANAEPFVVGISESASGYLCHTYHPSSGIISYGKTSAGTATSQNSNNSGGGSVAGHSYTGAHYTASCGGGSSSGGGAGGDDRNPWHNKTLIECLADIIQDSHEQKLKVSEIYRLYHQLMRGVRYDTKRKENVIRHTLSHYPFFKREPPMDRSGAGFWSYDPSLRTSAKSRKLKRQEQQLAIAYAPWLVLAPTPIPLQDFSPFPYRDFTPFPYQHFPPPSIQDYTFENLFPHCNTPDIRNDEVARQPVDPKPTETPPFQDPGGSYYQDPGGSYYQDPGGSYYQDPGGSYYQDPGGSYYQDRDPGS
ncbi:forkhead box protein [Endozoicomonas euniceicola]|uniref:Fork-head domain-containing protein n=1 Tax=Endozoicomonas euniceicola TaxID=1234143 RepID=A0ABY6GV45_9GAMM|nr:hypothetical protein [Endozoicomonas euniceicola]UYM16643.1 hypothetical protein NX720_01545 [Endozoicomonas euniceicola]